MSKEARRFVGAIVAMACLALPASAGAAVLHDQNSGGDGSGFFSLDAVDNNDFSEVADDFLVPAGETWTIRGVEVTGHYDPVGPPISSIGVRIYNNAGGFPAPSPIAQVPSAIPVNGLDGPSFSIPIVPAFSLPGGAGGTTYWISVQVIGLDYPDQVWDWDNRTPQVGFPAHARTTFPGVCGATPTWGVKAAAGCAGADAPDDQMFSLSDTVPTAPTPPAGPSPVVIPPATETGERAAALKKCKRKKSKKKRKKCRKRAQRLPV